jgi:hypothetical protein
MLAVLSKAALACHLDPLQGRGIRIGSTLEYLLRGVPFEVVKVKGRWAGDSFFGNTPRSWHPTCRQTRICTRPSHASLCLLYADICESPCPDS